MGKKLQNVVKEHITNVEKWTTYCILASISWKTKIAKMSKPISTEVRLSMIITISDEDRYSK